MPEVAHAVVPLLSPPDDTWTEPLYLRQSTDDLVERFPEEHLAVLYGVVGKNPKWWPHVAALLMDKLTSIESTRQDPRLHELRKRVATR